MSSTVRTTKYTYRSGGGGGANVEMEYGTDLGALTRLEDKIRLLHEDLESERELRQRVERERSDLTVQLMSLSERLDESEGNSSHVLDAHKKRDAEVGKLRKLLEDMHAESEENAHHLRTKHAAAVSELQEQMEALAKAKSKAEKEKAKFQAEVFELLSQVESVNKEKHVFVKTVEKLEHSVHESHVRIEELVRSVTEVTATRTRLATENTELAKEVHETKVALDTSLHVKGQLASQLEEARRRLEDEERRRSSLEQHSHTLELDLESHKVQLEEESEARLELERQLAKAHGEAAAWHSKYDLELVAHVEAVEELRKRLHLKISEYEEQLEALGQRCSALDKHKSRLTQEVEVLIMDLDKATQAAQGLEKRCQGLEKDNSALRSRVEELTTLLEVSVRDLRLRTQELAKASHEADKLRDLKEQLLREVKKLTDDLTETKAVLGDSQRRLHETETELRRLENEHSELGAAYKEAEQLRRQEEQRAQRLGAELAQVRHEAEKRLLQKQDELDQVRKSLTLELDALNLKLVEAETRLKTEVTRIKKKLQVTITELEMSLDVSQRSQLELQKTVKRQSVQISELQTHYEEVHRQLQQAVDQLSGAQRRNQGLLAELEELRVALDTSLRAKRLVETSLEEIQVRVNELTQVNVNLASAKGKLESEYGALQADYDSVHKELRVADERVQRTLVDLKVTKDALVEETERYTRVETIRRTLETEVKSLTVRLTEVEASALAGGKRVISKLETRIRDAELELEDERRKHAESQKQLRKKEHRVKELLVASEEDHKAVALLQDTCDKLSDRLKAYKRQLSDQEGSTQQNLTRVRRFQRELEAAEDRAEAAESNLSMIRAKHRSWVTTTQLPGGGSRQVLVTQTEEHSSSNQASF